MTNSQQPRFQALVTASLKPDKSETPGALVKPQWEKTVRTTRNKTVRTTNTIVASWENYIENSIQELHTSGIIAHITSYINKYHLVPKLLGGEKIEIPVNEEKFFKVARPETKDNDYNSFLVNYISSGNDTYFYDISQIEAILVEWAKTEGITFTVLKNEDGSGFKSWFLQIKGNENASK